MLFSTSSALGFALGALLLPAHAFPFEPSLFSRDSEQCGGDKSLTLCGSDLPSSFCCPSNTTCLKVNGTTSITAICCPDGGSCDTIESITCNITLQDPTLYPSSEIHTLNTTLTLSTCGDACCPLGYECNSEEYCVALTADATASTTTSATTTSSTTTASSSSTQSAASETSNAFSGRSFAAGFIPGLIIGALLLLGVIYLLARRRTGFQSSDEPIAITSNGDMPPAKAAFMKRQNRRQISDPIVLPQYGYRTDFHRGPEQDSSPDAGNILSPVREASANRSSSVYTSTLGAPSYYFATPSEQGPSSNHRPAPPPPVPPLPPGTAAPLPAPKTQKSLRRSLSQLRRYPSHRRRTGSSWASLTPSDGRGRDRRGTIRVVMGPETALLKPPLSPLLPLLPRVEQSAPEPEETGLSKPQRVLGSPYASSRAPKRRGLGPGAL